MSRETKGRNGLRMKNWLMRETSEAGLEAICRAWLHAIAGPYSLHCWWPWQTVERRNRLSVQSSTSPFPLFLGWEVRRPELISILRRRWWLKDSLDGSGVEEARKRELSTQVEATDLVYGPRPWNLSLHTRTRICLHHCQVFSFPEAVWQKASLSTKHSSTFSSVRSGH